jgi:predicted metal-dependent hydrolase
VTRLYYFTAFFYPPEVLDTPCIEYIVVHELVHLNERRHGDRFLSLMDQYLPKWRQHRQALNAAPLAHAEWEY